MTEYFGVVNTDLDAAVAQSDPLAGVEPKDLDTVDKRARLLLPSVTEWANQFPMMGGAAGAGSRVFFACITAAIAFPQEPEGRLADWPALSLTLFALDDVMDGVVRDYSAAQLATFVELCCAVVEGAPAASTRHLSDPERQVLAAIHDCFARFRDYPSYPRLQGYISGHWRQCLTAMYRECQWRLAPGTLIPDTVPIREMYLANAVSSFFAPAYFAVVAATLSPDAISDEILGAWDEASRRSSLAMRLANDLRSAERERLEGTVNSLTLLIDAGHTVAAATSILLAQADAALAEAEKSVAALLPPLTHVAGALQRVTRFYCAWCLSRDTHGLTPEQFHDLLTPGEAGGQ